MRYVPDWFPGAGFRRLGLRTQELIKKMINRPFDMVKSQVVSRACWAPAGASSC